jgi:Phage integrase family.
LIWPLLDGQGTFGALVKTLLLTGQRRSEVAGMTRVEIGKDGVWTIPAARYKGKRPHFVPLSKTVLALIEAQPKRDGCAFVFPSTAGKAFSGYSKPKAALDEAVLDAAQKIGAEPPSNWTLHDLRRTARTLMSAEKVPSEIAERVLGHAVGDIEATYNRHRYEDEKREALEKLAGLVERIVNPPPANVVPMRRTSE